MEAVAVEETTENGETTVVEKTAEEVALILEGPRDGEQTELNITLGDLKKVIRQGQFSAEEIKALVDGEIIDQSTIDVLLAHPIEAPVKGKKAKKTSKAAKAAKAVAPKTTETETEGEAEAEVVEVPAAKDNSANTALVAKIQELLSNSPGGLTIEAICVQLGVMVADADPRDADVRGRKKKMRALARRAVDGHKDGARTNSDGRNRVYEITTAEARSVGVASDAEVEAEITGEVVED